MSLGFRKLSGFLAAAEPNPRSLPPGVPPSDNGIPSTTKRGLLFERTEAVPLIRIAIPAPGSPLDELI